MWTALCIVSGLAFIAFGMMVLSGEVAKDSLENKRRGFALMVVGALIMIMPFGFGGDEPVATIPAQVAPPRGEVCESRPGWSCVSLQPEETFTFMTPEGTCYRDDFRQGISVKGQTTTDAGEKVWSWRENGVAYSAIMAENWASVPRAYYYQVTQKPATGCVVN